MNRCEELQILIKEGNELKQSAYYEPIYNNTPYGQLVATQAIAYGQPTHRIVVDSAIFLKWNTKLELFVNKHNKPIKLLKREHFPNLNIVQFLDMEIKTLEALHETWQNEDDNNIVESKNKALLSKKSINKFKSTKKAKKKKEKKIPSISNMNISINTDSSITSNKKQRNDKIVKLIVNILIAFLGGSAIFYFAYMHIENNNSIQQQNQTNNQQTIVNVNIGNPNK